jgi:hypothetical protein
MYVLMQTFIGLDQTDDPGAEFMAEYYFDNVWEESEDSWLRTPSVIPAV